MAPKWLRVMFLWSCQTAAQAGRLQDYLDAMSEYRNAARLGQTIARKYMP